MSGVTLEQDNDSIVAAKRSTDHSRLRHEAEILARVPHPGVVELARYEPGPPPVLYTAWAGTDTWERRPPNTVAAALRSIAALATTLADLHDAGICHRAVAPHHVIVAPDGRPVLCGFGAAEPVDDAGIESDTAGINLLIDHIIQSGLTEPTEPLRRLGVILDDPHSRIRDLVTTIDALADESVGPTTEPNRRRAIVIMVAVGLVTSSITFAATRQPSGPSHVALTSRQSKLVILPSTTSRVASTSTTRSPPKPSSLPTTTRPRQVEVVHDGRIYGLGDSGDQVVVGDWDCDGTPTAAILRVSDRTVAIFDGWPSPGSPLEAVLTVSTPDTRFIEVETIDTCDLLRAHGPYGSTIINTESP